MWMTLLSKQKLRFGILRRWFFGPLILCLLLLWWIYLGGCAFTIVPPDAPANPEAVFLLDHGRHSSLVLPFEQRMVRYSFGNWQWYAMGESSWMEGVRALFMPTPAGLGRKVFPVLPSRESVMGEVLVPIENLFSFWVESAKIRRLRDELEGIFQENLDSRHFNPKFDLEFVRHPKPYSLGHNSNTVVAGWLRELGFEVRGGGILSRWKIIEPSP